MPPPKQCHRASPVPVPPQSRICYGDAQDAERMSGPGCAVTEGWFGQACTGNLETDKAAGTGTGMRDALSTWHHCVSLPGH